MVWVVLAQGELYLKWYSLYMTHFFICNIVIHPTSNSLHIYEDNF